MAYFELPDLLHWFRRKRERPRISGLNRPMRRKVYLSIYVLGCVAFAVMVWMPRTESWRSTGGGGGVAVGDSVQQFGMLRFLRIDATNVDLSRKGVPGLPVTRKWDWRPGRLAVSILGTVFVMVCCMAMYPRTLKSERRAFHLCDECGYEMRGLGVDTKRCPECGGLIDKYGLEWIAANDEMNGASNRDDDV